MVLPPANPIAQGQAVGGQAAATTGTSLPQTTTGIASNVGTALANLPANSLLPATIQSKTGTQINLSTSLGRVSLQLPNVPTSVNTSSGENVWLRVMPDQSQAQAQLQNQTGTGSGNLRLQLLSTNSTNTQTSGLTTSFGFDSAKPLTPGANFTATVPVNLTLPNGLHLPAGSQLSLGFLSPGIVSSAALQNAQTSQNQAQPGMGNVMPGAQTSPGDLTGGASSTVNAGSFSASAAPSLSGNSLVFSGTLLPNNHPAALAANLPASFSALNTSEGIIGIRLPGPAPIGVVLSFATSGSSLSAHTIEGSKLAEADLLARGQVASLTHDWRSLSQALGALSQFDPGAAMAMSNAIPQPDIKLAATMMMFFAAMTGGSTSLRNWIGDRAFNSLSGISRKTDDDDLLEQLDGDFGRLKKLSGEHRPDGWRVMPMPFLMDQQVEQIRLAWRDGNSENTQDEAEDAGTRFLLDLSFSSLGHTQLDGLIKQEHGKFDLIVRSENSLTSPQRDDIRQIFRDGLDIAGYQGQILFQDRRGFIDLAPIADPPGSSHQHGIDV